MNKKGSFLTFKKICAKIIKDAVTLFHFNVVEPGRN